MGRIFFPPFFHEFALSNSYIQSSQRRLGEGAPTASQSAHRELAPTYPNRVHRLVCSHLRNTSSMASSVDQYSSSARPTPVRSSSSFPTSIFQASRAPFANARETEHYGRRTKEGYRGMCSDTLDPGGECVGVLRVAQSRLPTYHLSCGFSSQVQIGKFHK